MRFLSLFSFLLIFCGFVQAQDVIDVVVKGISDNNRDGAQKDRLEAIMDAKRQACEKAGLSIETATTVENFQTVYDYVETQAAAILLPGFQVIDNGYNEDGSYTVVLVGKVSTQLSDSGSQSDFAIIIWLQEDPQATKDLYYFIDKLYAWLNSAAGKVMVNDKPLERLEDNLVKIYQCDSALWGNRKAYAFQYLFPTGEFIYQQRTPTTSGSISKHDFKIRLRPGLHYVMDVAHDNAIYFNNPKKYEGQVVNKRLYGIFPGNFSLIYQK